MNASILTIDNSFVLPVGLAGASPRADARGAEKLSAPDAEEKSASADSVQTEDSDNMVGDAGKGIEDKPAREFRQVLRDKAGDDSSPKPQDVGQSKEDSPTSDVAKPKEVVQTWLAENAIGIPQSKDGAATRLEPKAGRELAQLLSALKAEKSPPATGHAAKSAQIKALAATEKGQLGIKTVLPEKSNGLNGLKTVWPANAQPAANARTDNIVARGGPAVDAETLSEKTTVKSRPVASSSAGRVEGVPPSNRGQHRQASLTGDARDTASLKPAISETAANLAQKQSQPAQSDAGKDVQHPKTGIRQTQAESSNAGGKDSAPGVAKSATTDVHTSEEQGDSRGRSAARHNSAENIGQILAQSNPNVSTASQSTTAAAHARGANVPGQNSAADVSADIGKQILESIHGTPAQHGLERQITVRLNPPELGRVFIKLQEQEAGLMGVLEVSRSQTRFEIEHALPEIIRNLAECGVQVRRFDVVLSEQGRSEQEAFGGQSMPNNGRYEHNPAERDAWADETTDGSLKGEAFGDGPSNGGHPQAGLEAATRPLMTHGSLNLLI